MQKIELSKLPPTWATWSVGILNLIAIGDLPFGFYQFLRLAVTGYAGYLAWIYFQVARPRWAWTFTFIAVLYNPFLPLGMEKGDHTIFNLATFAYVIFELYKLRPNLINDFSAQEMTDEVGAKLIKLHAEQERKAQLARSRVLRRIGFVITGLIFLAIAVAGGSWGYLNYQQEQKNELLEKISGTAYLASQLCAGPFGYGTQVNLVNHTSQTILQTFFAVVVNEVGHSQTRDAATGSTDEIIKPGGHVTTCLTADPVVGIGGDYEARVTITDAQFGK